MKVTNYIASRFYLTKQSRRVRSWKIENGDEKLRLNYHLSKKSVVFDLGGYKGQFASDIFSKFCCDVYVFEPVEQFYKSICARFESNDRIQVFPFGLADKTTTAFIDIDSDRSCLTEKSSEPNIFLRSFAEFMIEKKIEYIDLIKINIEGAEYDLLDHILKNNLHIKINNIQIQFHDFITKARERRFLIQKRLEKTHQLTWCYPFVWENWSIKEETD